MKQTAQDDQYFYTILYMYIFWSTTHKKLKHVKYESYGLYVLPSLIPLRAACLPSPLDAGMSSW